MSSEVGGEADRKVGTDRWAVRGESVTRSVSLKGCFLEGNRAVSLGNWPTDHADDTEDRVKLDRWTPTSGRREDVSKEGKEGRSRPNRRRSKVETS